MGKVADLRGRYPQAYSSEVLDVTDTVAIHELVEHSFARALSKHVPGEKRENLLPWSILQTLYS